jgi:hypothetical protein
MTIEQALECVRRRVAHLLDFHGFSAPIYGISIELDRLLAVERDLGEAIEAREREAQEEVGPHFLACAPCRKALGR